MNGTITFESARALAQFLSEFTGSTAKFEVVQDGSRFILTFLGGF